MSLRDDNLYLTQNDHCAIVIPLKKRIKELETLCEKMADFFETGEMEDEEFHDLLEQLSLIVSRDIRPESKQHPVGLSGDICFTEYLDEHGNCVVV